VITITGESGPPEEI